MCVALPVAAAWVSMAGTAFSVVQGMQQQRAAHAAAERQRIVNQQQATYASQVAANNQIIAENMAKDEVEVGRAEQDNIRERSAQIAGNAQAVLSASGFAANEGDAPLMLADIREQGELDARTARRNADNRAKGHRFRAANFGTEAAFGRTQAAAFSQPIEGPNLFLTAAAGASRVADKWHSYKGAFETPSEPEPPPKQVWV